MRNILEVFFRRRTAITLIAVVSAFIIIIGTYCRTPRYMSETRIMIPLGRELGTPAANLQAATTLLMVNYADQLTTQMEVLNNRRLIEDALAQMPEDLLEAKPFSPPFIRMIESGRGWFGGTVDADRAPVQKSANSFGHSIKAWLIRHGITHELTEREQLVVACGQWLKIERQNESGVLYLRFTHPSPEFAQAFLKKFLDAYEHLRASSGTAGSDMPFYADQENQLRDGLRETSNRLAEFRKQWGLLDIHFQREQYTTEMARLDALINVTRSELIQASAFLETLQTDQGKLEPETILSRSMRDDVALTQNLRSLAALLARESRLRAEVGRDHPELSLIRNEMNVMREGIYKAALSTLNNQAYTARIVLEETQRQREELENRMATLEAKALEMRVLESEVEVAGDALLSYGRNREAARVTSQMDTDRINTITVIEPPTRPYVPEAPKPLRDIFLGLIFSVFLGLCYAYLSEVFSDIAYSLESVAKKFPEASLVSVPEIKRRGKSGEIAAPENALAMVARKFFYKGKMFCVPRSMLMVGSGKQVGTSMLAGMLAQYLARTYNLRVLLVDTHLPARGGKREPNDEVTLTDWLMDRTKKPQHCEQGNVCHFKAGPGGPEVRAAMLRVTPADLSLLEDFDTIIFDAASLNADSVTFHLAALAEATLPVVRLEHTRKAVLDSMNDELALTGAPVLGIICNRRRFYIPQWIYKRLS